MKLTTQQQEQRILNIEQKLENITNKMELTTTNNKTTNNITNNNTNNGTINNINVIQFGKETIIENLPKDELIALLRMTGYKSIIKSILYTYFSKRFPEGHVFYMNHIDDKHGIIYDKLTGKVILEPIDEVVDTAIQNRLTEFDELLDECKDELNEQQLNHINDITDGDYPPHLCKKVKQMAVKHKEMVKNTIDKVIANNSN